MTSDLEKSRVDARTPVLWALLANLARLAIRWPVARRTAVVTQD